MPNLVPTEIDLIFKAHQVYLDEEEKTAEKNQDSRSNQGEANPLNALLQAFSNGGGKQPLYEI